MHFPTAFKALTGNSPFPWQSALYERFCAGDIPETCSLPTGLGKTSLIALWLLARISGAAVPRRLVYVVNRRTVVDQTTAEVEKLCAALRASSPALPAGVDLAVSTLRGQMADKGSRHGPYTQASLVKTHSSFTTRRILNPRSKPWSNASGTSN
jgi:CRISPR-associated endonuclease/helicase Cas3